jgi:hypothetical protein
MHGCSAISALPTPRDLCYRLLGIIGNVDSGTSIKGGAEPGGNREHPCMVSPLRNSPDPLDPAAAHPRPSRASDRRPRPAPLRSESAAGSDDLQRLESSIAWLQHEARQRLPRAGQLPPVSGISAVHADGAASPRETFRVAPPLACERLQLPPPRRQLRNDLRGALWLMIACVIAGSIAYQVSAGGLLSAWEPAQAAFLQAH